MYLGRLSPEKGLDILLEALRLAGNPRFNIVGDGPMAETLEAQASELKLTRLSFLGRVDRQQVKSLINDAGFLVFPSVWEENAPLAALEAMANSRALITSDRGGLPELAGADRGIVFEAGQPSQLADAMRQLTGNKDTCQELGNKGRTFAENTLTADKHLAALENAYTTAISS